MKNRINLKLLLLLLLPLYSVVGKAQSHYFSPYSRFGVGDIVSSVHPTISALGGSHIALRDKHLINYNNPASYTALDTLSFLFDGGFNGKFCKWTSISASTQASNASIGHLTLGVPITKRIKMSTGLKPYSQIGYHIYNRVETNGIGDVLYEFFGDGGLNNYFIGIGIEPLKGLSIGMNATYIWGDINHVRYSSIPDSAYTKTAKFVNNKHVKDFFFTYGIQYEAKASEKWNFAAGAVYSNKRNLNAIQKSAVTQIYKFNNGTEEIFDTIKYIPNEKGTISIPESYGIGVSLTNNNNFKLFADYRLQNWKNTTSFGVNDSLQNSNYISFGVETFPSRLVLAPTYKKLIYRFGMHYSQTNLKLKSHHLNDYGVSVGVAFPVRHTGSSVNLALVVGQVGTVKDHLVQERYVKFSVGFSIFERWFVQRKYH